LIQDDGLTIRSKTVPESVKLVLSKEADDQPSVVNIPAASRHFTHKKSRQEVFEKVVNKSTRDCPSRRMANLLCLGAVTAFS
jgi:hypothetical protein